MKSVSFFVGILVVLLCLSVVIQAQDLMPGMVDMRPMINVTIDNMINTKRTEILAGTSLDQMIERDGLRKIKMGKATTRFVPTAAGTSQTAANLSFNGELTNDKPAQIRYINEIVSRFNKKILDYNLTVNDAVDGYVLAYALAYEAYTDEKLLPATIKEMQQKRRQELLKNAYYQGQSDQTKQATYEQRAIFALLAIDNRIKSRQAKTNFERNETEHEAVQFAKNLLNDDVDKLRNEQIVKSGQAKTTFLRGEKYINPTKYASDTYAFLSKDAAYFENLLQQFDTEVKKRGCKIDDLACGIATAVAINYYIYSDSKIELNSEQYAWTLREMQNDVLSESAGFQSLTNKQKQEHYETTAIKTMLAVETRQDDLKFLERIPQDMHGLYKGRVGTSSYKAYNNLKELFAPQRNFDEYELDSTGFVKK